MSAELPTKPGPYYWREKDGDEWELVRVELHIYNRNPDVVHLSFYSGEEMRMLPIKDMKGQWLPIPTAEELVELRANAKMVDEGIDAWAVFKKDNEEFLWSEPCLPARIFTESAFICEPVTICRKGKE